MAVNRDAICIAAMTPVQAEAIRSVIKLRDVDQINCVPLDSALVSLHRDPPALVILEAGLEQGDLVAKVVSQLPSGVVAMVITDEFDEEFFLSCHDAGVRDYLVRPLPDSYLLSRILLALDGTRQQEVMEKRDELLTEMGVLSPDSGVFSTSYFLRLLKNTCEEAAQKPALLLLAVDTGAASLPPELHQKLMKTVAHRIRSACRGFDVIGEYMVDKFAVMLPDTGMAGLEALAERLNQSLNEFTMIHQDGTLRLKIHLGLAEFSGCRHYEDLINHASDHLKSASPSD